jgi:hypothetical protein
MITFGIGGFGYDESVLRAKFDAEPAALAPLLNDVDNAARYLDALFIKGLSPRGHDRSFTKVKRLLKDSIHLIRITDLANIH